MKKLTQFTRRLCKTLTATALIAASNFSFAANDRPNILIILADDLGYADVGFNGSPDIRTPNLDELAKTGVTMTSAYAAHAFCGPSRAGLLTGRYPHKFGSQFNLPTNNHSGGLGIPLEETFISKVLQDAGYYTGIIGKWHLGETAEYHPNNRGFDEFYGFLNGGHHYFPQDYEKRYQAQKDKGMNETIFHYLRPLEHNGKEVKTNQYLTDELSDQASQFIKKADQDTEPFFLYLSYNAPHTPLEATKEDMDQFPEIKDKKRKIYAGMVYAMDRGVGEVVKTLKQTGQYENTLIVFFSDNGGKTPAGANNAPLRGRKGDTLEGGFRVPMFFHWPQQIKGGREYKHIISALDLYPTLTKLANAKLPTNKKLDGLNVMPAVLADVNARPGQSIFAMRHRYGYTDVAIRKDDYKALLFGENAKWELYDAQHDPAETKDLSQKYPVMLRELVEEGEIWSWQHVEPKWFHIHKEGFDWREKSMPRFHETFAIDSVKQDGGSVDH